MSIIVHVYVAVDNNGILPVHEAAYCDKLDCLKFLLKNGAKLSDKDNDDRTPLHKVQCNYL